MVLNNSTMKKSRNANKKKNKQIFNSTILKFILMIKSQVVRIPFAVPMPINNYGSFTAANGICVWNFFSCCIFSDVDLVHSKHIIFINWMIDTREPRVEKFILQRCENWKQSEREREEKIGNIFFGNDGANNMSIRDIRLHFSISQRHNHK